MNGEDLRALQAPIKAKYKSDAAAALVTLTAKGAIDDQTIACKVETGDRKSVV